MLHRQIQLQEKLLLMALTAGDKLGASWERVTHPRGCGSRGTLHAKIRHLKQRNRGPEMCHYLLPASELDPAGYGRLVRG